MYRYKIEGIWTKVSVEKGRIRNLLLKGTLTPYDFIKGENEDATMICKHNDFKELAFEEWAKLREIRNKLNLLWKGQLDAIMSGIVERVGDDPSKNPIRGEEIIQNLREQVLDSDILDLVDKFCRSKEMNGAFDNEITRRTNGDTPYIINDLIYSPEGSQLSKDQYEQKKNQVREWIVSNSFGHLSKVCYAFRSDNEVLYIGQTQDVMHRFFGVHFVDTRDGTNGRKFCHECSTIEVYNVNGNIDGVHGLNNFENLMIYRHGAPESNNKPKYNESSGVNFSRGPVYKLQHFITKEVDELKS